STPLGRTAAVVGLGRDIGDRAHLQAGGLERADRGLTTRAGALDKDIDLLHAVLLCLAGGVLRGELGGEGRRLARALEADVSRGRPGQNGTGRVGDRDEGVVARAPDVGLAVSDVLLFPAATRLLGAPGASLGGHYFCSPATGVFGPLRVRALVWVRWPRTGRPRRWRRPW